MYRHVLVGHDECGTIAVLGNEARKNETLKNVVQVEYLLVDH